MKIAIAGLGRMGAQIARKLSESGHDVIAHNRHSDKVDAVVAYGAKAAYKKEDVVKAFEGEQLVLWLMIPAEVIDEELDTWLALVPKGSLIIDGGNSDFRLDKKRETKVSAAGSTLVDVGTSGGVWGYQNGFCMMAGGREEDFKKIEPALKSLAAPTGGYEYFGPNGAGHFVKMVHNAIEYGMMQSLADGYLMLKDGPYKDIDLAKAGNVWQKKSVITSWLNELAAQSVAENPNLEGIDGAVAETGEARWTLEVAKEMNIPMPAIRSAFEVRLASQKGQTNFGTKLLSAMRNKFGGHAINKDG
ncbi:MAG TPA: decarboxylating 6-phosphogluconate dehydrogenase [Patescibacteria group bacterium]|nr:decarboxylating 6-phosphogluconate dehydrogenase [Patescibacteria group bacterium]